MVRDRSFWIGMAAGAAAGAAGALLFAPKSGEELRGDIKQTTEAVGRKAGEAWNEVQERTSDVASQAQSKVEEIGAKVMQTTEAVGRKAGEAWDELQERSSDVASQAQSKVLQTADKGAEAASLMRDKLHQNMGSDKSSHKSKAT